MKKTAAIILVIITLISLCSCSKSENAYQGRTDKTSAEMSTSEFVQDMGIGINLGNTFEACGSWIKGQSVSDYETAWGSPIITKKIIQGYADEGFGVIRIPVAWSNMMSEDYKISDEYINRVKEVVKWALDADMKVILNIHYDGGWWEEFSTDEEKCMNKYTAVWTQLCDAFGDFDHDLMFESLNEEGCWDDIWNRYGSTAGKAEAYALLGRINQQFVNIVRESGDTNATRHLLIAGYATDVKNTCDDMFVLPDDPANRYAVSVHYYTPSTFAIIEEDASWGKARSDWGTDSDYYELDTLMDLLEETFVKNDIPVIIGEYGCALGNKTKEVIELYLTSVCKAAYERGMCPVLWDTTGKLYDRDNCKFYNQDLMASLRDIRDNTNRNNLAA